MADVTTKDKKCQWVFSLLAGMVLLVTGAAVGAAVPGLMVLAPDRGVLGNEEVRDVFAEFKKHSQRKVDDVTEYAGYLKLLFGQARS